MNRLESEDKLSRLALFLQEGVLVGDGITILQTETLEEAASSSQREVAWRDIQTRGLA